MNKEVKVGLRK